MIISRLATTLSLALLFAVQYVQAQGTDLQLEKDGTPAVRLTATEFAQFPRIEQRVTDHDGKSYTYSGTALVNLLSRVNAPMNTQLRGKALAQYLLVQAADGYQVVFALPELDSSFTKQVILLANQRDGQPLPAGQGPYRIIVPNELKQARWVRQVKMLRIVTPKE